MPDGLNWGVCPSLFFILQWYASPDYNLFGPYTERRKLQPDQPFYILHPSYVWQLWDVVQGNTQENIQPNPPSSGFIGECTHTYKHAHGRYASCVHVFSCRCLCTLIIQFPIYLPAQRTDIDTNRHTHTHAKKLWHVLSSVCSVAMQRTTKCHIRAGGCGDATTVSSS